MGCSASKLDDEEAVQICKDRRNFIKQAVEHRARFASNHITYLQSLRRVSIALHDFIDSEERHDFFLDSYSTPPFTPVKKLSPEIVTIPFKSITSTPKQNGKKTVHVLRHMQSNANSSVTVEEWPQASETVRVDSYSYYYPTNQYGMDNFFASNYNNDRSSYPQSLPQDMSQWDYFWNPFTSSSDIYGSYPSEMTVDDEMARLRQVRIEEGIPELEEDVEEEDCVIEDQVVDDGEEEEEEEEEEKEDGNEEKEQLLAEKFIEIKLNDTKSKKNFNVRNNKKLNTMHYAKGLESKGLESIEVAKEQKVMDVEVIRSKQEVVMNSKEEEGAEETPGFTVYVDRRPKSMKEVVKEIENQFLRICDCANEISVMLEASKAQYSSPSSELTAIQKLNPIALFHSASSRSTSSRFLLSSSSREDSFECSSSDWSEDSCMISGSHQSTLDRLYAWEKKLYEEVKCGERIKSSYEKKCLQLQNQDVNGEEPASVHKMRMAIRDLHTRLKVSIHSVESISKRIESLRDEELHPQLIELVQGLSRMWTTMSECHSIQKHTVDNSKHLILSTSFPTATKTSESSPAKPPRSATNLETELRHWRSAFCNWITSQRAYALSLSGWAHRCCIEGPSPSVDWASLMGSLNDAPVIDGLDFFASGIGSVYRVGEDREEVMSWKVKAEKTAELAGRVLCAGMSVAVGSLAEFAGKAAEGHKGF